MKISNFFIPLCILFSSYACANHSACSSIRNNNIEEVHDVYLEYLGSNGPVFNQFTVCKIQNVETYFLLLTLRPSLFLDPNFIDFNEFINNETAIDEGFYAHSIISLKKSDYVFLENMFKEFSSHSSKDFEPILDGPMWCFSSKEVHDCFDLTKKDADQKLKELIAIYNFVRAKFPNALKKQEKVNQILNK